MFRTSLEGFQQGMRALKTSTRFFRFSTQSQRNNKYYTNRIISSSGNYRGISSFNFSNNNNNTNSSSNNNTSNTFKMDQSELKKRLTPIQYSVTQHADTERAFTGIYDKHFEKGEYLCIVCEELLFSSDSKFNSGCGWPAFSSSVSDKIQENIDNSHGMKRVEVVCKKCKAHLGHVFNDGPKPTGIRYCINSASLNFKK